MKRNDGVSKLLGLTQQQLAMLLGTTRSRVSLFELGLRPLPAPANQRLKELLLIDLSSIAKSGKRIPAKTSEQHTTMFKELLDQNDYQQKRVTRQISNLQEKDSQGVKGQTLLDYLAASTENKEEKLFPFLPPVNRNAKYILQSGQSQRMKYEIQLKVLQYEAELLREAMGDSFVLGLL